LIALIVLAVRGLSGNTAVRSNTGNGAHGMVPSTPLEILQARYARSEISRDEYMQARETLQA
jgi:uncharacterized membrane protein